MSVFISSFAAMGAFAPEANPSLQGRNLYLDDKATMNKNIIRIIGKAATVAAASMRVRMNRPFIAPRDDMSYTENMLYMMDAMSEAEGYRPDKRLAKALDILFILHADHEMNCSTATMTHVGSSMVDPYVSILLPFSESYRDKILTFIQLVVCRRCSRRRPLWSSSWWRQRSCHSHD